LQISFEADFCCNLTHRGEDTKGRRFLTAEHAKYGKNTKALGESLTAEYAKYAKNTNSAVSEKKG
jgi:hypothetical protein